jgi:hypothetical protein
MKSKMSRKVTVTAVALVLMAALCGVAVSARADGHEHKKARHLYIWAGDRARTAPDFLAVVNFDESSKDYGKLIRTVPLPPPGNTGNEPHHMHLSADGNVLGCGGLLSLLKGQNGIFFFDVSKPDEPRFIKSANAIQSSIVDDFFPIPEGGFLVTNMGSAAGGAPGRVAEFDKNLNLVAEWPATPPTDGFNPHGISVRPEANLMVTSDFINPVTTLNAFPGPLEIRGSVRVWDYAARAIVRTIPIPTAIGTMDVKLIPGDPLRRAYTFGMFDGLLYLVDTTAGTATPVFDTATINPFPVMAMPQIMAVTHKGDRLIFPLYGTGQIVMLDISNPAHPKLLDAVDLGAGSGPHDIDLTEDDKRLVVTDYFLNEDDFGKIHLEGDLKVHVLEVKSHRLKLDSRFNLDFRTQIPTGPARPHGIATK